VKLGKHKVPKNNVKLFERNNLKAQKATNYLTTSDVL
jgi:hypothetical protein